ncbi:hypothetical protein Bbelb_171860 [Branchiostoma belcheri]|nr:hypothetical protein Bbelb_171860 [Branchiostoma belcheri]
MAAAFFPKITRPPQSTAVRHYPFPVLTTLPCGTSTCTRPLCLGRLCSFPPPETLASPYHSTVCLLSPVGGTPSSPRRPAALPTPLVLPSTQSPVTDVNKKPARRAAL